MHKKTERFFSEKELLKILGEQKEEHTCQNVFLCYYMKAVEKLLFLLIFGLAITKL